MTLLINHFTLNPHSNNRTKTFRAHSFANHALAKCVPKRPWPVLGLSGGIACGKSTASDYLKTKGAQVIDADQIARELLKVGTSGYKTFLKLFKDLLGPECIQKNGQLNRTLLNNRVFTDPQFRKQIEDFLHPLIFQEMKNEVEKFLHSPSPHIIIFSAPLLFETGLYQACKENLLIASSEENQIKRLKKRDEFTRLDAMKRIQAQMPLDQKRCLADWVIENDGKLKSLHQQLDSLWPDIKHRLGFSKEG